MKKFILTIFTTVLTINAYAQPNVWQHESTQGFDFFYIKDTKGNAIRITCNSEAGSDFDHSIKFIYKNGKIVQNTKTNDKPLSFLVNGDTGEGDTGETKSENGASMWNHAMWAFSQAKRIDVGIGDSAVAVFKPTAKSRKEALSEMQGASCKSLRERKDF